MAKILLLNGETVQVVCMARALRKLGHEVSALCSEKCSSGYMTRYLHHKYMCPDIHEQSEAYKECFYGHIKDNKYDLIIPMYDDSADFLSKEKGHVESEFGMTCAIEDYETFTLANDKQKLMEVCEKYDIVHPKTRELTVATMAAVADYVGFPAMVKPNLSGGAKGIVKVENMQQLQVKYPPIEKEFGRCTLQQYVEQPDYYYNVMLYRDKEGKTAGWTIIKIRRFFPLKGGSSCYSETVEHPFLLQQCEEVLDKLNWHGFADFDVLEDKHTGELKIIEINPRTPSSFQASFAAGVNFAEIFVNDYLGGTTPTYSYKVGQQVRWFGLDAMWFAMSADRFKFKPSWFRFFGKNVSYHDGTWSDPLPMVAGILAGVVKYMNPSFRKAKLNK